MPRQSPEEKALIKSFKARTRFFENLVNNLEAKGLSDINTALLFEDVVGENWRDLFIPGTRPSDAVIAIIKRKCDWYTTIVKVLDHPDEEIRRCTFMRALEANLALIEAEKDTSVVYRIINGMFDENAATSQFIDELKPLLPRLRYEFLKKIVLFQFQPEKKIINGEIQSCVDHRWSIERKLTQQLKIINAEQYKKLILDYPQYASTLVEASKQVVTNANQVSNTSATQSTAKTPANPASQNILEAGIKYCEKIIIELQQIDDFKKTIAQLKQKFQQLCANQEYLNALLKELFDHANTIKKDTSLLFTRFDAIHQQLPFANFSTLTKIKQTILNRFAQFNMEVENLDIDSSKHKLTKQVEHLRKGVLDINETVTELWKIVKQQESNLKCVHIAEINRRKQEAEEKENRAFLEAQERKLSEWKAYVLEQQEESNTATSSTSACSATSSTPDEPKVPEIHPEISDDLLRMPKAYFELTQRILNLEKGIKYNSVCLLIEKHLHGKIQDNGTSHRKICLLRGELTEFHTGCKRDKPTGVGGLWNKHKSGSHPTELIPFSVGLVRDALVNAGITLERVAEIAEQRRLRKEVAEEANDSLNLGF